MGWPSMLTSAYVPAIGTGSVPSLQAMRAVVAARARSVAERDLRMVDGRWGARAPAARARRARKAFYSGYGTRKYPMNGYTGVLMFAVSSTCTSSPVCSVPTATPFPSGAPGPTYITTKLPTLPR